MEKISRYNFPATDKLTGPIQYEKKTEVSVARQYQQQNKHSLKLKISNVKAHYFANHIQKRLFPACGKIYPDSN